MSEFAKTALFVTVLMMIVGASIGWTAHRDRECEARGGVLVRGVLFSLECVEPRR